LSLLESVAADERIAEHHRLHALRGHLHEMAGDHDVAGEHFRAAARRATSEPEQRYLLGRAARLAGD
jgi:predicted RNA polymerase sigma factor